MMSCFRCRHGPGGKCLHCVPLEVCLYYSIYSIYRSPVLSNTYNLHTLLHYTHTASATAVLLYTSLCINAVTAATLAVS